MDSSSNFPRAGRRSRQLRTIPAVEDLLMRYSWLDLVLYLLRLVLLIPLVMRFVESILDTFVD